MLSVKFHDTEHEKSL